MVCGLFRGLTRQSLHPGRAAARWGRHPRASIAQRSCVEQLMQNSWGQVKVTVGTEKNTPPKRGKEAARSGLSDGQPLPVAVNAGWAADFSISQDFFAVNNTYITQHVYYFCVPRAL